MKYKVLSTFWTSERGGTWISLQVELEADSRTQARAKGSWLNQQVAGRLRHRSTTVLDVRGKANA